MRKPGVSELAPRRAVTLLVLCYAAALVPMQAFISPFPILLVAVCLWIAWRGGIDSIPLSLQKILVFSIGLAVILLTHGTLIGLEPGISFLLVLLGLKLLESKRPRDFQVLVLLGYFIALTLVFFSPGFGMVLAATLLTIGATAALIQSLVGDERMPGGALRAAAKLFLQGLPLMAILFVFFPRGDGLPFEMRGQHAQSGFGDTLEPGSISSLALSDEPVFRAVFPDGNPPSRNNLYWRGLVLQDGAGLSWHYVERYEQTSPQNQLENGIRQQITLLPHRNRWLFALDRPAAPPDIAALMYGNYLLTRNPVTRRLRYDVTSLQEPVPTELGPRARLNSLRLRGSHRSPRLDALVRELTAGDAPPGVIVERSLDFFRNGGFEYSLQPGTYRSTDLDEFLFERKTGFCEHYAGAFATILRMAGVPARIVLGYQGGSFNQRGDYILVRQADAHAWCEVWLEGTGWQRVDPTAALAPARLTSGLEGALAGVEEDGVIDRAASLLGVSDMLREARLFWDNVEFQWDQYVLNFDTMAQWDLFDLAGLPAPSHVGLLLWVVAGTAAFIVIAGAWIAFANRPRKDPVVRIFEDFCNKAASMGCERPPAQGPRDFSDTLIQRFPGEKSAVEAFISAYLEQRYGPQPLQENPERLRKLERAWRPTARSRNP